MDHITLINEILKVIANNQNAKFVAEGLMQEILDQLRTNGHLTTSEYETLWSSYLETE